MKNTLVLIVLIISNFLFGQNICIDKYVVLNSDSTDNDEYQKIGLIKGLTWTPGQTLKVAFLGGDRIVKEKVIKYANEWSKYANIKFEFINNSYNAEIRIAFRSGGSWSYIGKDALSINKNLPTMNFGWFNQNTSEASFRRTILHEFGHALGAIHEHQHPEGGIKWNKPAVYSYYMNPPNNWTKEEVDRNIFQKYSVSQFASLCPYDRLSIMHYAIPNTFTQNNYSVGWNTSLSSIDKDAIKELYPRPGRTSRYWSDAKVRFDKGGWILGDYNGDNKCDILRYGVTEEKTAEVFLSTGEGFKHEGNWGRFAVGTDRGGILVGDYNGDGKDDFLRYGVSNPKAVEVFLSTGSSFRHTGTWTRAGVGFDKGGILVGDYNGDGKDDFLRYGVSDPKAVEVFLSTGSSFRHTGTWTRAGIGFDKGGIVTGDYNGDEKDDFLRYGVRESNSVEVFLSTGTSFSFAGTWKKAEIDFVKGGITVGDYNGDNKDDFLRYGVNDPNSIQVFLSTGSGFYFDGEWTKAAINFSNGGFYIGDFHGDGKDDFFRYKGGVSSAEVFFSNGEKFETGSTCRD